MTEENSSSTNRIDGIWAGPAENVPLLMPILWETSSVDLDSLVSPPFTVHQDILPYKLS